MIRDSLKAQPIEGKTYTLFGHTGSTVKYYKAISMLADKISDDSVGIADVIEILQHYSERRKLLGQLIKTGKTGTPISRIIHLITPYLAEFTERTAEHLKTLPVFKYWDRRLATTREQYHLYMLEIELTNRLHAASFKTADKRIALLPYCLQDFSVNCKAAKIDFDYQCRHCSGNCFQNHVSMLLNKHHIDPFIWMGGNMKQLASHTLKDKKSFAVLGIACVPELLWGLRKCQSRGIPAVGLPLNANRCIRWFGEFHPNSVDLTELEKLISVL